MSALQIAYDCGLISCPASVRVADGFALRMWSSATESIPPVPAVGS